MVNKVSLQINNKLEQVKGANAESGKPVKVNFKTEARPI
jgi:hypothetical protein